MTKLEPAKELYKCPQCESTEFTADVITQHYIEIDMNGNMIPLNQIEKPQQDNIDEGSVMCAQCDEDIDIRALLKLFDDHVLGGKL